MGEKRAMNTQPRKPTKMSYTQFLKSTQKSNERLQKMREEAKKNSKFSKPSPFGMRMRYWRPDEEARWIRLIPFSTDEEFYTFYQTWVKVAGQNRTVLCNCQGGKAEGVPCVPCYYANKEQKPDLLAGRRDAITVLVLEDFHKVKQKSKSGNEYTSYEPCQGVDRFNRSQCKYCDEEVEKVFGHQYYWNLGFGQKMQLEGALKEVGEGCLNCHTGYISKWGWACKECGSVVASLKEQDLDDDDIHDLMFSDEIECQDCGHTGPVRVLTECVHPRGAGSALRWVDGCDNPTPVGDIWKMEFLIKTAGDSNALVIEDWRPADETSLEEWQLKPMDFDHFLSHEELDSQAKRMGRENPFDEECQVELDNYFKALAEAQSDEKNIESYEDEEAEDAEDDVPDYEEEEDE